VRCWTASFARRTVTQAFVALGLTEAGWSGFYHLSNEPRIYYENLTGCFLCMGSVNRLSSWEALAGSSLWGQGSSR
jgi:hypothetical protein